MKKLQKNSLNDAYIRPEQLCVGLYIHLDLGWTKHPFSFASFKIEKPEQISTIKGLGLKRIRYSPIKSDCEPASDVPSANDDSLTSPSDAPMAQKTQTQAPGQTEPVSAAQASLDAITHSASAPVNEEKRAMMERMNKQGEKILACEREFLAAARALKSMWQNMFADPLGVSEQATEMVDGMAESAMMEAEIAIHLMIDSKNGSDMYTHALNVAILSMILAKEMGFSIEEIKLIGLGAVFHDVGCTDIPRRIKEKNEPLTPAEAEIMHRHCKNGIDICNRLQLPYEALLIVWQHHERTDGSGYPARLRDKQISPLASIVAVADAFDEICNPINKSLAHTPHEALSLIYAQQRTKFDARTLTALVHSLGVYPPGTIVLLSNGVIGMVVAVNAKRPLKPTVLIYDADIPKDEVMLIDLDQDASVTVTKTVAPHQLAPEILDYLAPGKRASYYFRPVETV
ncbi:HD-GYP domain-containing protein [Sapientia aquatica]|uniref:HD-GYP domain-containing protein n=1 Tax=Sapientia aquatica TaxID=1549640 RepID=A0A4R5W557_9BURK|nr:HD-GYP domain-containing protein [Sapientia aquatica]